jgi:hypothetical protein
VEVEISEDQQVVHFDFNSTPFQIHDGNFVLANMNLSESLDHMSLGGGGGGDGVDVGDGAEDVGAIGDMGGVGAIGDAAAEVGLCTLTPPDP